MILIRPELVTLILTLLIPVGTALATRSSSPARTKAVVTIVLAAAATLIGNARSSTGAAVLSTQMVAEWATTTAVAIAAYLGVWKPIASINDLPAVLPDRGL